MFGVLAAGALVGSLVLTLPSKNWLGDRSLQPVAGAGFCWW
jgi:hypothetical protein